MESSLPEHRERLFSPTETLSMFLAQALKPDRSCQNIVNDAAVKRLTGGEQTLLRTLLDISLDSCFWWLNNRLVTDRDELSLELSNNDPNLTLS
jgi:hypothetical protein